MDLQKLITRAWEDENFKLELLADPRGVIEKELGVQLPPGLKIFIHEQLPDTLHLILPEKPAGF